MTGSADMNVYDLAIPQFINSLTALKANLAKGKAHCDAKKVDFSVMLQTRLIVDQFPLGKQIHIACDTAKLGVTRLTGKEAPTFDDSETTYEQFVERIDKTIGFLKTIKAEDFKGYRERVIKNPRHPKSIDGHSYVVQHMIPNIYFHTTTAYSIMRANGVDLGKNDYLGQVNWKAD